MPRGQASTSKISREDRRDTAGLEATGEGLPASLAAARDAAAGCTRCPLYKNATQTVFGEGPAAAASLMLVGEQPGDQEDIAGRPFVGPAGRLLDRALEAARLPRTRLYVTNAVKHFKNEPRGKRRLHKKPNAAEIDACRWWLDLERRFVKPAGIVALGASALRGLTGRTASISSLRGEVQGLADGTPLVVTVHPSYLLRLREPAQRGAEFAALVEDLARAAALLGARDEG